MSDHIAILCIKRLSIVLDRNLFPAMWVVVFTEYMNQSDFSNKHLRETNSFIRIDVMETKINAIFILTQKVFWRSPWSLLIHLVPIFISFPMLFIIPQKSQHTIQTDMVHEFFHTSTRFDKRSSPNFATNIIKRV